MTDPAPLCSFKDLKDGLPLGVTVDGRKLVVCRVGDDVRILDGVCPHRGAPLEGGFLNDGCLVCPWHGWQFRLDDGAFVGGGVSLNARPAVVRDGKVYPE
ncbi:MAG TPA: Rieske (2Fe-2S) protein [Planctomycetota bacterium]|nr:Rieske (2Fe-2S) protein [Planctomycetota bacterium]